MSNPAGWWYAPAPWWLLVLCGLVVCAALLPWPRRREQEEPCLTAAEFAAQGWRRIVVHPPARGEW